MNVQEIGLALMMLRIILVLTAVTTVVIAFKTLIEYLGYLRVKEHLAVTKDMLRVSQAVNNDTRRQVGKIEAKVEQKANELSESVKAVPDKTAEKIQRQQLGNGDSHQDVPRPNVS